MPSVIACPSCQKQLKVPDEYIGRNVKCPGCKETFMAQAEAKSAPPPPPPPAQEEILEKPRKKPAPPPEEEEEAPRPAKRRQAAVVDDDEEEERPSRRSRRGAFEPHRGVLILLLGIGALVFIPLLGPVAWILGNIDLKAMDAGRMDPEGRQMTQIGKILGIIATVFMVLGFLSVCLIGAFIILGGVMAAKH
jgi:predicted Zn finger-like uncharacterized protein